MLNDDAVFTFDLKESLYFANGQEVAEMKGISLDPEIAIQDYDDYVAIRGVIELQGEYTKHAPMTEERLDQGFDHHSKRFVERVMDIADDEASFMHRFPIEISVPSYRVSEVDDVYVHIDAFDYELPDPHQINFTSSISIHGIGNDDQSEEQVPQSDDTDSDQDDNQELIPPTFEFESRYPLGEDQNEAQPEEEVLSQGNDPEPHDNDDSNSQEKAEHERPKEDESESIADIEQKGDENFQEHQTLGDYFSEEARSADGLTESQADRNHDEAAFETEAESNENDERKEIVTLAQSEPEADSGDVKDVMYLANMFASEEETYAKMVMYMVQHGDTLDSIASRYDVQSEQILRYNRLDDDIISEGQPLYIPVVKEEKR